MNKTGQDERKPDTIVDGYGVFSNLQEGFMVMEQHGDAPLSKVWPDFKHLHEAHRLCGILRAAHRRSMAQEREKIAAMNVCERDEYLYEQPDPADGG